MAFETLLYEVEGPLATVTLNRPEKLNAFTARMGAELADAIETADADDAVRAVILTGAGRGASAPGPTSPMAPAVSTRPAGPAARISAAARRGEPAASWGLCSGRRRPPSPPSMVRRWGWGSRWPCRPTSRSPRPRRGSASSSPAAAWCRRPAAPGSCRRSSACRRPCAGACRAACSAPTKRSRAGWSARWWGRTSCCRELVRSAWRSPSRRRPSRSPSLASLLLALRSRQPAVRPVGDRRPVRGAAGGRRRRQGGRRIFPGETGAELPWSGHYGHAGRLSLVGELAAGEGARQVFALAFHFASKAASRSGVRPARSLV